MKPNLIQSLGLVVAILCVSIVSLSAQCNTKTRLQVECNNNDTPCDPSDDYYDVSGYMFHNGGDQWTATINGTVYGPFDHTHQLEYFGQFPANGAVLCVMFRDIGDPNCFREVCSEPLTPCPTTIDITFLEYECNDNGTANDPTDDYYTVKVRAQLNDFLPDYDYGFMVEVAGEVFGPFRYGSLAMFDIPADGQSHKLVVVDENDFVCMDMESIGPLTPCSVPCTMIPQILTVECFDNGTPSTSDDFYKVTVMTTAAVHGAQGLYTIDGDFLPSLVYKYGEQYTLIFPARGQEVTLTFTDADYLDCWAEVIVGPFEPCSEPCEVEVDSISYLCFDNNTPNPDDDYYELVLKVSGSGAGSGYTAFIDGQTTGPWEYDSLITFTIPANGQELNILIKDVDFPNDCRTFVLAGPLEPCSLPCELTLDQRQLDCFDNQTSDTLDDYYIFTLQVSEPGHKPGDQYEVTIGMDVYGPYDYGEVVMIQLPSDGSTRDVTIRDTRRGQHCELNFQIGPLIPCSSACELEIEVSNIQCYDEGTGLDPSDDSFTFDITVNGTDVGAEWEADDAAITRGAYGETKSFGPYPISGGPVSLNIFDTGDVYCRENVIIQPPEPCSDSCFLELIDVLIGDCNDNNTGNDTLDDYFFVELLVGGINNGAGYEVSYNGMVWGPFNYNEFIEVGPLPADGQNHILLITDTEIGYCQIEVDVSSEPCSECLESGDAGLPQTLNCSINEVQLSGSSSSGGDFLWIGPGNLQYRGQNPRVKNPGWYRMEITFSNGCVVVDSVEVRRDTAQPAAAPLTPEILTCKTTEVWLDAGNSTQGNAIVHHWTNAQGDTLSDQENFMVNVPGVYCLEVRDTIKDCGSGQSCVEVLQDIRTPDVIILVDPDSVMNCKIDSVRLNSLASPNTRHIWTFHNNNYSFDTLWVKDTGMVYITVTDTLNGCTSTEEIHIESLLEYPIVNIQDPPPLTCNVLSVEINTAGSQVGPSINYQWFDENNMELPGQDGPTLEVNMPGTFYFEVIDTNNGCTNIDTVEVTESKIYHLIDAGPDDEMRCDSDELALSPQSASQQNLVDLYWTSMNNGVLKDVSNPWKPVVGSQGRYIVTIEDKSTGCITSDTVDIFRAQAPIMDVLTGDEICLDAMDGWIDITSITGGTAPFDISLNGNTTNERLITSLEPGQYSIKVIDDKGCEVDTIVSLSEGKFFTGDVDGKINIKQGDTTTLTAQVDIPLQDIDYITWSVENKTICQNCNSIDVSPEDETTYDVLVVDKDGCQIEMNITIFVRDDNRIWAPNAFTPDGDQVNDLFNVHGKNLVLVEELIIYDRWGEQVYQGEGLDPKTEGWDGMLNGENLNPAVFVFYAVGVFRDGTKAELYGDLTLIR